MVDQALNLLFADICGGAGRFVVMVGTMGMSWGMSELFVRDCRRDSEWAYVILSPPGGSAMRPGVGNVWSELSAPSAAVGLLITLTLFIARNGKSAHLLILSSWKGYFDVVLGSCSDLACENLDLWDDLSDWGERSRSRRGK